MCARVFAHNINRTEQRQKRWKTFPSASLWASYPTKTPCHKLGPLSAHNPASKGLS